MCNFVSDITCLSLVYTPISLRVTFTISHSKMNPLMESMTLKQSVILNHWRKCTPKHFEYSSREVSMCWQTGSWQTSTTRKIPTTRKLNKEFRYVLVYACIDVFARATDLCIMMTFVSGRQWYDNRDWMQLCIIMPLFVCSWAESGACAQLHHERRVWLVVCWRCAHHMHA